MTEPVAATGVAGLDDILNGGLLEPADIPALQAVLATLVA